MRFTAVNFTVLLCDFAYITLLFMYLSALNEEIALNFLKLKFLQSPEFYTHPSNFRAGRRVGVRVSDSHKKKKKKTERKTERKTDRQTDRQTDRKTERQTERKKE